MLAHVSFWKFDADGKDTDGKDNPCQLEGDGIFGAVTPPGSWIKYSGSIGTWRSGDKWNAHKGRDLGLTDDNSEEECPDRLSNI